MSSKTTSSKINNVLNELKKQEIHTWFDLGLFMDHG